MEPIAQASGHIGTASAERFQDVGEGRKTVCNWVFHRSCEVCIRDKGSVGIERTSMARVLEVTALRSAASAPPRRKQQEGEMQMFIATAFRPALLSSAIRL
jgi:hypothetical protein